jgi:hypothetical protein
LAGRVLGNFMLAIPAQYDWKIFFLKRIYTEWNNPMIANHFNLGKQGCLGI